MRHETVTVCVLLTVLLIRLFPDGSQRDNYIVVSFCFCTLLKTLHFRAFTYSMCFTFTVHYHLSRGIEYPKDFVMTISTGSILWICSLVSKASGISMLFWKLWYILQKLCNLGPPGSGEHCSYNVKWCWLLHSTKLCEAIWFLPPHCGTHTHTDVSHTIHLRHRRPFSSCEQPTPRPRGISAEWSGEKWHANGAKKCCAFACCVMAMFPMHESEFNENKNDHINVHARVFVSVFYCKTFLFFKHKSQNARKISRTNIVCVFLYILHSADR